MNSYITNIIIFFTFLFNIFNNKFNYKTHINIVSVFENFFREN